MKAYVGHHSGFALPSGERVHLLVFGVLTLSLRKEKHNVGLEFSMTKQTACSVSVGSVSVGSVYVPLKLSQTPQCSSCGSSG